MPGRILTPTSSPLLLKTRSSLASASRSSATSPPAPPAAKPFACRAPRRRNLSPHSFHCPRLAPRLLFSVTGSPEPPWPPVSSPSSVQQSCCATPFEPAKRSPQSRSASLRRLQPSPRRRSPLLLALHRPNSKPPLSGRPAQYRNIRADRRNHEPPLLPLPTPCRRRSPSKSR